jgi:hypothetical protein
MRRWDLRKTAIVLSYAFVVWALCGALMGIGLALTTEGVALILHAVGAPLLAVVVSFVYFRRHGYTSPLQTALAFFLFALLMDAALVAPVFEKSYEMFSSFLGVWLPLTLVFMVTYLTGVVSQARAETKA